MTLDSFGSFQRELVAAHPGLGRPVAEWLWGAQLSRNKPEMSSLTPNWPPTRRSFSMKPILPNQRLAINPVKYGRSAWS